MPQLSIKIIPLAGLKRKTLIGVLALETSLLSIKIIPLAGLKLPSNLLLLPIWRLSIKIIPLAGLKLSLFVIGNIYLKVFQLK